MLFLSDTESDQNERKQEDDKPTKKKLLTPEQKKQSCILTKKKYYQRNKATINKKAVERARAKNILINGIREKMKHEYKTDEKGNKKYITTPQQQKIYNNRHQAKKRELKKIKLNYEIINQNNENTDENAFNI